MAQKVDVAPFLGSWKITYTEEWGQDYVDLVVPGHLTFESEGDRLMGWFQFGTVVGWMDCRVEDIPDGPTVEWSWQGQTDFEVRGQSTGRAPATGTTSSYRRQVRRPSERTGDRPWAGTDVSAMYAGMSALRRRRRQLVDDR